MLDIKQDNSEPKEAKCPQCGELMANIGLDFAAPKKDNIKEWKHLKDLYSVGIAFHSCGCGGPGYIPKDKNALIAHLEEILSGYNKQLAFWRKRIEPSTERERQREMSKHLDNISRVPYDLRPGKGTIKNEDAKNYWLGKIKEVDQKISKLSSKRGAY